LCFGGNNSGLSRSAEDSRAATAPGRLCVAADGQRRGKSPRLSLHRYNCLSCPDTLFRNTAARRDFEQIGGMIRVNETPIAGTIEQAAGVSPPRSSPRVSQAMRTQTSYEPSLANSIIEQIERVVRDAEEAGRPLEIDPYRGRLFELFVMADAAELLKEPADERNPQRVDLTADGLCRALGERWNLADAVRSSSSSQTRLPPEHLSRMRLLWSVMRMWMEWTYAWQRWAEFHQEPKAQDNASS
jgi:hypothetical protein